MVLRLAGNKIRQHPSQRDRFYIYFIILTNNISIVCFVVPIGISLGSGHTLMLKDYGTVWTSGANAFGQLGISTKKRTQSTNFLQVMQDGVKAVAAGSEHSIVLKEDGSVWAAGRNINGQLGDGSNNDWGSFVQVIPGYAHAVAAGAKHSLAIMRDGSLRVTGYNACGQLGDGSTIDKNTFEQVASGANKAFSL